MDRELAHASHAVSVAFHYASDCIEKASVRCRNCQFALWSVINFRPKPGGGQSRVMPPECQSCGQLVCYACGCTENMACTIECADGVLPCAWVGPGLCSHCLWRMAEFAYNTTNAKLEGVIQE